MVKDFEYRDLVEQLEDRYKEIVDEAAEEERDLDIDNSSLSHVVYVTKKLIEKADKKLYILTDKFEERLNLFLMEPNHPILRNHKLSGKYHLHRSINITGDYRLIFTRTEMTLDLEFIGTHSQLY